MTYPAWWSQTVTVYHRVISDKGITWHPQVLDGCFVQRKETTVNVDTSRREGCRIVCRIRAPKPEIALGDILFAGANETEIDETVRGQTSADFMAAHPDTAFIVEELHDNTMARIPVPHVYVGGA